jgi:phage anti-repressor protein
MTTFTKETAIAILDQASNSEFPISFDDAWQWLGYSEKSKGKRALLASGFTEGVDFAIAGEPTTTGIQAHPKENISLSVECLKMWAMMSGTEKGKQVRLYFLECERIAKAASKPMNVFEMVAVQAAAMGAIQRQTEEQAALLQSHESRLDKVESYTIGYDDYMCIRAYCNVYKVNLNGVSPSQIGKQLTKSSRAKGLEVKKVFDARYGNVNAYHLSVLKSAFPSS